jgi:hypothetical protein
MRRRRARLIKQGLCTSCGKVPPRPDRRKCEACAKEDVDRAMRRYNRRKVPLEQLGLCPRCATRKVMPGTRVCGVCSERWNTYKGTLRARYKQEGLCVWCGGQRDRTDRVLCASCRQKRSARHRRAVALQEAS